jgi:hypothetical protein
LPFHHRRLNRIGNSVQTTDTTQVRDATSYLNAKTLERMRSSQDIDTNSQQLLHLDA